ncbi:Intraflagellar transport protein 80 [Irineochytrium annulatum]|nr:Intraflagellar transport protein 80 [Irineochytrium annulatum]
MLKWTSDGEFIGPVPAAVFDSPPPLKQQQGPPPVFYVSDLQWFPPAPGKGQTVADLYVAGGTDGRFYLCSKGGRVEKVVDAHKGALLALKWNYEGSALVTAGEDGQAKIWSRSGMLRSVLVSTGYPIYSIVWSPDNDQILYTNGRNLVIKPIQPSTKPNQWKAHDGVILKVDWNFIANLIISGGEDRKYKVWDSFGRQLYSSSPHDHPITSLAWNPSGEMREFGLGRFFLTTVKWSYAVAKPESGSIFSIAWTPDGTQIACAGGDGAVVFGHVIDRRFEWKNYEVTLLDDRKIQVHDVIHGANENLEFRDRIVKASFAFAHLIVATSVQCYVYSDKNWNTPAIIDLTNNGRVICIKQSSDFFAIVDNFTGIQIFTYEGRTVSHPKYAGIRPEFITLQTISLSNDVLVVKDRTDEQAE